MDATEQENCESELYLAQANQTSRFNTQQDAREGRFNRFTLSFQTSKGKEAIPQPPLSRWM